MMPWNNLLRPRFNVGGGGGDHDRRTPRRAHPPQVRFTEAPRPRHARGAHAEGSGTRVTLHEKAAAVKDGARHVESEMGHMAHNFIAEMAGEKPNGFLAEHSVGRVTVEE